MTVTISHTNITNATLAATASTSLSARTAMTVVSRTAAAFLSETSAVQLTNTKTTGTGFSLSTNSTRVASFSMNITPAAAAASSSETKPVTTALKNNTITISTTKTRLYSTKNKRFPPVQETTSRIITKLPQSDKEIPTKRDLTINSNSTDNSSAVTNGTNTNGTSTIVSAFSTVNYKIKDSGSIVYVNISHGRKTANTKNFGNLYVGNNFPGVDPVTVKKHSLLSKTKTSSTGLDRVKFSSHAVQNKINNSEFPNPTSSTSPSLSHQTSHLDGRQLRDVGNALSQTADIRDQKRRIENYSDSKASTGFPVRKVRTQRSISFDQGSIIKPKTVLLKDWTSLQIPLKFEKTKVYLKESPFFQISTEVNVDQRKHSNNLGDKEKGKSQVLKKKFKFGKKNHQIESYTSKLSSDKNDRKTQSRETSGNQKSLFSAMTSTRQDLFSWKGCRFCSRMSDLKKWRDFLKSPYYVKRERHLVTVKPTKMEFIHFANTHPKNLDNKQGAHEIHSSASILKQTNDDRISRGMFHSEKKKKEIFDISSRINPLLLDTEKKETGFDHFKVLSSQLVSDKTHSFTPTENISLVDGDETLSKIYRKTNITNNTNIQVLSGQTLDDSNLINSNSDNNKTSQMKIISDKVHKCNNDKLCPASKPELLQRLKSSIFISPQPLIKTSMNFLEAREKDNTNQISNDDKSQDRFYTLGFAFGKYTQVKSLESGRKSKTDLNSFRTIKKIADKTKETPLKDKQFLLSKISSDQTLQQKQFLDNQPGEKLHPMQRSDSFSQQIWFEGSDLTNNKYTSENSDKNVDSMNTNKKDKYSMLEIPGQNDSINEDYTRNQFKSNAEIELDHKRWDSEIKSALKMVQRRKFETEAEKWSDINGERSGYQNNAPHRTILTEQLVDAMIDNEEAEATVEDEEDEEDNEKWNKVGKRKPFKEDDDDNIWDKPVNLDPFNHLKDTLQREKARKEREYSWLRNAYESVSYWHSHDFFLDPEFEKKRLERKVLRRGKVRQWHNWQQNLGASVHAKDIYLPLYNIHPHSIYHPTISNPEKTNGESHYFTRIRRSTSNYRNIELFGDEKISEDDNHKPCGNHGRHRSHVGGMHHLTRHQRRDTHQGSRTRHRFPRDVRFPSASQTFTGDGFGKAAYFSGVRELLQLRAKKRSGLAQEMIPRQHFTIELWIKPEGGQRNPTVILGK